MTQMPMESIRDVRAHLADRDGAPTVVSTEVLRRYQEWEEREINRIIDERMASPSAGIPIEDVMRETLERGE